MIKGRKQKNGVYKMVTDQDLRRYLIQFKLIFGLGLTGIFSIMKAVFDYQHIPMGIGYIALIIGIGNIIWAIYDYIMLRKIEKNEK
jgi:uncharacterized membrane protein